MKRFIGLTLAAALTLLMPFSVMADSVTGLNVKVILNDNNVVFSQKPFVENGYTLVPLREMLEALNADVTWDETESMVYASKGFDTLTVYTDDNKMLVNGETVKLGTRIQNVNGKIMAPLREIAEAFDAKVEWDKNAQAVIITSSEDKHIEKGALLKEVRDNEDGQLVLSIKAEYPIIDQSGFAYEWLLNDIFKSDASKFVNDSLNMYGQSAAAFHKEMTEAGGAITQYTFERSYDVTYSDGKYISVTTTDYVNLGGAHPSTSMKSCIYDVETGLSVGFDKIFNRDTSDVYDRVKQGFYKMIDAEPDMYFDDAKKFINDNVESIQFLLDDDGLVFYCQPYDIAPYARGYVQYKLTFKDNAYLLRDYFTKL